MYYIKEFLDFAPDIVPCDFYCYHGESTYNSPSGRKCSRSENINYEKDCKPFQIISNLLVKNDTSNGSPREYEHVRLDRKFPMFRFRADNIEKIFRALEPDISDTIISEMDANIEKQMNKRCETERITEKAQKDLKRNERIDELFDKVHFHINQKYCKSCPYRYKEPISSHITCSTGYDEKSILKLFDAINDKSSVVSDKRGFGDAIIETYAIDNVFKFKTVSEWGREENEFFIKKNDGFELVFKEAYYCQQDESAIKDSDKPWYDVKNKILSYILLNKLKSIKPNTK